MTTTSISHSPTELSPDFQTKLREKMLSENTVSCEVNRLAIEHMRKICTQAEVRKTLFACTTSEQKKQLLAQGIFYPNDYADFLESEQQTKRYEFLKKKDYFYTGYLDNKTFSQPEGEKSSLSQKVFMHFKAVSTKSASEALDKALSGPSLLGCGEVCQLAYYAALRTLWGEEKFNTTFHSENPLTISHDYPENPLYAFTKNIAIKDDHQHLRFLPGSMIYMRGAEDYKKLNPYMLRHPGRSSAAFNTIQDFSEKRLGFGLNKNGLTHEEIQHYLFSEFQREKDTSNLHHFTKKIAESLQQKHIPSSLFREIDTLAQESFERFKERGGGKISFVIQFHGAKVKSVLES